MHAGVTAEEARGRLGLSESGPLEKAAVRRAYLQAIKKHKPEVDPEGFRLAREAFELLDQLIALGMEAAPPIAAGPAPPPAADTGTTPPAGPSSPQGPDHPRDTSHLEPFRERLRQMFGLPWHQRAEVGWAAYDSFPGDLAAREFLLELLPPQEARADIVAILLEGVRVGDPSCLYRLLRFAPEAVPIAELERMENDGSPYQRLLAAQARIERGDPDRGLVVLDQLLAPPPDLVPEPGLVAGALETVFRLEARGDLQRAALLRGFLHQYLGGPTLPAGSAGAEVAALFALSSELASVELPAPLRRELARGALIGHFWGIPPALAEVERAEGWESVDRHIDRLAREAPTLASIVKQHRGAVLTHPGWLERNWGHALWLVVVLFGAFLRNASSCSPSTSEISPVQMTVVQGRNGRLNQLAVHEWRLQRLCPEGREPLLCQGLPAFLQSLSNAPSCALAEQQLKLFRAAASTPDGKALVEGLAGDLPTLCAP
jgi:hypothetical protein